MLDTPPTRPATRATEPGDVTESVADEAAATISGASPTKKRSKPAPSTTAGSPSPAKKGRAWRWARRILLVVVLAVLAVGAYLIWPDVYDRYIEPIDTNTTGLGDVEQRLEATNAQLAEAQQTIGALEAQVAALVAAGVSVEEDVAGLTDGLAAQIAAVEAASLRLDAAERTLNSTEARTGTLGESVDALEDDVAAAQAQYEERTAFLAAVQLLSRSRLFLYQANYGLAEADVRVARDLLGERLASAPTADLEAAVERLDLVLAALPDTPVLASDDLDIAWQLLLDPAVP